MCSAFRSASDWLEIDVTHAQLREEIWLILGTPLFWISLIFHIPGVPVLKVHIYIFEFQKKNEGKNYITEIF